jgi:hypothetical protein
MNFVNSSAPEPEFMGIIAMKGLARLWLLNLYSLILLELQLHIHRHTLKVKEQSPVQLYYLDMVMEKHFLNLHHLLRPLN